MPHSNTRATYRKLYSLLIRLYPKFFREHYSEPMEQTFNDLLRERENEGHGIALYAFYLFAETSARIVALQIRHLMLHNTIFRMALATAVLLLIPLIAMQFTNEVNWSLDDFIVAGGLLFGTGLAYELVVRRSPNTAYRFALGVALAASLMLVWINLAVGLIGSEHNPANQLYGGVLLTGAVGAAVSRFRAAGMSRTLFATALTQALVPIVALIIWKPPMNTQEETLGIFGVFVLNGFFVALYIISALLFRKAAGGPRPPSLA